MTTIQILFLIINNVLLLGAAIFLTLTLLFALECLAATFAALSSSGADWDGNQGEREAQRVALLIPAHNEESLIQQTVTTLLPMLKKQDQLLVIADNCTDATATVASQAGANVIERHNPQQRGKGYALAHGIQALAEHPPDAVLIVDADCQVKPGSLEKLTHIAIATQRPVQASYLIQKPQHPTPKDSVSAFAIKVKNLVRPQGLAQLGVPCLLTGSGMAFPWSVINTSQIATGNIVEDMKLGIDLAIAGHSPMFCAEAQVTGQLPTQADATVSQRTRWEHGHIQTLLTNVPRLLWAAGRQKRGDLFVLGLDLAIPPLSLFVLLWVLLITLGVVGGLSGLSWLPAILSVASGGLLFGAIALSWVTFARADFSFKDFLIIPLYIFWKIPVYFKFLIRPQREWVRTKRPST